MEEFNGVMIYWLISVGLLVGFATDLILMKRSMGLVKNLVSGAAGAVIFGAVFIAASMSAPLLFSSMATIGLLFLINVFSLHPENDPVTRIGR